MSSVKAADVIESENFPNQKALSSQTFLVHLSALNPDLLKEIGEGDTVISSIGYHNYAVMLFNKRYDIPRAIEVCMESVALGNRAAQKSLMYMMNAYSVWLFNGEEGVRKNIPKAIEVCRRAADFGNQDSIRNLPLMIAAAKSQGLV